MWAALGGAALGALSKGIDFGFGAASAKMQYDMTRKLRRREYQDMMHSMKSAGLNPMLAMGATPGHSAAPSVDTGGATDLQGNVASAQESSRRSNLNKAEKSLLESQTAQTDALRDKAIAEKETAEATRDATVYNIFSQGDRNYVESDFLRGPQTARTQAETDAARKGIERTQSDIDLNVQRGLTEASTRTLQGIQGWESVARSWATAAQTRLAQAQTGETNAAKQRLEFENTQRELEADFYAPGGLGDKLRKTGMATDEINTILTNLFNIAGFLRPKGPQRGTTTTTEHYDAHGKPKGATRSNQRQTDW